MLSPKCPSSITCFSVWWYYYTSKLSNFDFISEKIQTYNPINIRISAPDSSSLNTQHFTCMTMIPNYKTQTQNAPWQLSCMSTMCNILIFSHSTSCKAYITPFTSLNIFQISILAANFGNYKTQQYVFKSYHQSIFCFHRRHLKAALTQEFLQTVQPYTDTFPLHNKDNAMPHMERNLQMSRTINQWSSQ